MHTQKDLKIITIMEKKYKNLSDQYLRLYSDFENYKKRIDKEKTLFVKTVEEVFITEILEIVDDFELSLKQQSINDGGLKYIYNKFILFLKKHNVEEFGEIGEIFDPEYHEAISTIWDNNYSENVVVRILKKGYMLNGVIIRYSKVIVNKK